MTENLALVAVDGDGIHLRRDYHPKGESGPAARGAARTDSFGAAVPDPSAWPSTLSPRLGAGAALGPARHPCYFTL